MADEFYVGYVPKAPTRLAVWIRGAELITLLLAAIIAVTLLLQQLPFPASRFEYGVLHDFAGVISNAPAPNLLADGRRILLSGEGKHGVGTLPEGRAKLRGTWIERGPDKMIELAAGSLQTSGGPAPAATPTDLGPVTLQGEIVDSKCYLGVMNPGNGKVHRDCAVRCISGGVPPAFLVRDQVGEGRILLLAGSNGRSIGAELLPWAGQPVRIAGRLMMEGSTYVLQTEPIHIHRE